MSLRGRQVRTAASLTCRFLVITVGGVRLALQADHVQGLLTANEVGSAETLIVQGLSYVKVDLARRLDLADDPSGPELRIVLISKGSARAYVRVTQVHGLTEVEQSRILPLPRQFRGEERQWYQGMILFEAGVALVLHPAWVTEECGSDLGIAAQVAARPSLADRPAVAGRQV